MIDGRIRIDSSAQTPSVAESSDAELSIQNSDIV